MPAIPFPLLNIDSLERSAAYLARIEGIARFISRELHDTANVEFSSGLMGAMDAKSIEPLNLDEPAWKGVYLVCFKNSESGDMPEKISCALGDISALDGMPMIPAEDGFDKWKEAMGYIKETLGLKLVDGLYDQFPDRNVYSVEKDANGNEIPLLLVGEDGEVYF